MKGKAKLATIGPQPREPNEKHAVNRRKGIGKRRVDASLFLQLAYPTTLIGG